MMEDETKVWLDNKLEQTRSTFNNTLFRYERRLSQRLEAFDELLRGVEQSIESLTARVAALEKKP